MPQVKALWCHLLLPHVKVKHHCMLPSLSKSIYSRMPWVLIACTFLSSHSCSLGRHPWTVSPELVCSTIVRERIGPILYETPCLGTSRKASFLQLDRVQLDAEHVGDPSLAPRDQPVSASWKPHAYQMSVPPKSGPQQVSSLSNSTNACILFSHSVVRDVQ